MVESERYDIGVNLEKGDFEVSSNSSRTGSWSLGCNIIIEESDAEIQEIRVKDIALSSDFSTENFSVEIHTEVNSDTNLDINFGSGVVGAAIIDEINGVKDSLDELSGSLRGINEAIGDINEEAFNIKVTINGIQRSVNDLGTEVKEKASATSVIELGEQIVEIQNNAYEQTRRIDGLSIELSEKASAESVTKIGEDLVITNKTVAEQQKRVDDLSAEISTKASSDMVTKIADDLKITNEALAEQTIKVNALSSEISTKASAESVADLEAGLQATSKSLAEQTIRVNALESEISSKANTESVVSLGNSINVVSETVAEQKIRTDEIEASIENLVTKEVFNAATGETETRFALVKQTTDSIETTIKAQGGEIVSIKETVDGLSVGVKSIESDLNSLRNEMDGVTESYFDDYIPSNTNEPAVSWIAEGTEADHEGDTFTHTGLEGEGAGKSWRWLQDKTGEWSWHPITDTDAQKALALAAQAQAAADGKVTIFYEQPKDYKIGDIWFVHNNDYAPYEQGEILSATTDSSVFDLSHWEDKTRYTNAIKDLDETMRTTFKDGVLDEAERKVIEDSLIPIKKEKEAVEADYNIVIINASFSDKELKSEFEAAKNEYDDAYYSLVSIINEIVNTKLEGEDLKELFEEYEGESEEYSKAYGDYIACKARVTEAMQGRLNPANIYIDNIASDGYLTPVEKEQLFEIYRNISKEYEATRSNAYNYKIWKYNVNGVTEEAGINGGEGRYENYVAFRDAYSPIATVFSSSIWGFTEMDETTELPEGYSTTLLKGYLDAYYEAHGTMTESFSAITAAIEEAQKKAEHTLNELTGILSPEEMYTQIGKGVVLSTIIATRDTEGRITAGMNASESQSDKSEDNHGRVVFVGGVRDINDFNDASFVVYEDGHVKMSSAEISDYASIGQLQMGLDAKANVSDFNDLLVIVNNFINSYSKMWRFDENGNLVTEHNVVSMKEISAGGAATPEEGGAGLDEEELQDYLDEKGYITETEVDAKIAAVDVSDQLKDYATKKDVDDRFEQLIGEAPEALDTLKEIADALKEDDDVAAGIISEVATVKGQVALHTNAIASLGEKNTEQDTAIGQIQQKDEEQDNDIDGIKTRLDAAEKITSLFGEDEKGVFLKNSKNFYTRGEISAGGAASEGGGEGGDVVVGGSLDSLEDVDINEIEIDSTLSAAEKEAVTESQVLSYDSKGVWVNKTTMYIHRQQESAKVWEITHNMNKMPNVKVIDAYGELVFGTIKYDLNNLNRLEIHFGGAFSGRAYLD